MLSDVCLSFPHPFSPADVLISMCMSVGACVWVSGEGARACVSRHNQGRGNNVELVMGEGCKDSNNIRMQKLLKEDTALLGQVQYAYVSNTYRYAWHVDGYGLEVVHGGGVGPQQPVYDQVCSGQEPAESSTHQTHEDVFSTEGAAPSADPIAVFMAAAEAAGIAAGGRIADSRGRGRRCRVNG